jgi:hypothetical protein
MKAENLVRFLHPSQFLPLKWENFPLTQFSKSPIPCSLLRATYHVYHPFKMTAKNIAQLDLRAFTYETREYDFKNWILRTGPPCLNFSVNIILICYLVIKALDCKLESRGFEPQRKQILNLLNPSGRTRPWGLLSL